MKKIICYLLGIASFYNFLIASDLETHVDVKKKEEVLSIENDLVRFNFDLASGIYSAIKKETNELCLSNAFFQVGHMSSNDPQLSRKWESEEISDSLGFGKKIMIICESPFSYSIMLEVTLYNNLPYIVLCPGITNNGKTAIQCKNITPFVGDAFAGIVQESPFYTLDGNGGAEPTEVNSNKLRVSRNNLMLTFGQKASRKCMVLGGLTYHEFEKNITLQRENNAIQLSLSGYDPVGKRVDAGQTYMPNDKFYIDFVTTNPFESLEQYGLAVRKAQKIYLPIYDFPTVCLWYAGSDNYGGGPAINDSKGAVWETENIAKSGFFNYSRAAVRLVPDNYAENNQQGWWDDTHYQQLPNTASNEKACYISPYETTEKWAQEVSRLGGIPFIYSQTARRAEDYATKYPEQMLFNQSHCYSLSRPILHEAWWMGTTKPILWSYDFTDSAFVNHMKQVYANFNKGGIKGMMFDYPQTAWNYEGGFDDAYATTASAYRQVFKLANDGLGSGTYINERNLERGSDITFGVVASHRTWGDTDLENPKMVSRGGLRWYKNRVVINYDMDAKNLNHCLPNNRIGQRSMLTMSYVTTGRFLMGLSFSKLTPEQFFDLTRVFPFHTQAQSARPVDAFIGKKYPEIYDFKVNESWHQLTVYNAALDNYDCEQYWYGGNDCEVKGIPIASRVMVNLGLPQPEGGLALSPDKKYYLYDFWNDHFIGKYTGSDSINFELSPAEARMISIHEVESFPQFISTNRHIMQGYIDMIYCIWDNKHKVLKGKSKVVANEAYKVDIACNGFTPSYCTAKDVTTSIINKDAENGIIELIIESPDNRELEWEFTFK